MMRLRVTITDLTQSANLTMKSHSPNQSNQQDSPDNQVHFQNFEGRNQKYPKPQFNSHDYPDSCAYFIRK